MTLQNSSVTSQQILSPWLCRVILLKAMIFLDLYQKIWGKNINFIGHDYIKCLLIVIGMPPHLG